MKQALFFAGAAIATLCAACTSIPLASMPRLAGMDPKTLDPAGIEVAVRAPDTLHVSKAHLTYAFLNKATGEKSGGAYELTPVDDAPTRFLNRQDKRNTTILRYQLSPEGAQALAEARDKALAWPTAGKDERSFTLSAGMSFCLKPQANPFRRTAFTVFMRETPEKEFFTLMSEQALKLDGLKRCEE